MLILPALWWILSTETWSHQFLAVERRLINTVIQKNVFICCTLVKQKTKNRWQYTGIWVTKCIYVKIFDTAPWEYRSIIRTECNKRKCFFQIYIQDTPKGLAGIHGDAICSYSPYSQRGVYRNRLSLKLWKWPQSTLPTKSKLQTLHHLSYPDNPW